MRRARGVNPLVKQRADGVNDEMIVSLGLRARVEQDFNGFIFPYR